LTHSPAAHLLTYGTEFYQQKQKPEGPAKAFPDAKTNFASGWVQDEITFRDLPVSLLIGTRFDRYKAKNPKNADISADNWSITERQGYVPHSHRLAYVVCFLWTGFPGTDYG